MEKASQDKREKNASYQPEMHVRNANSREIFKNNRLTSQFLRNYTDIPLLANVMPEDIEDVSEKYQAFLGVEFESAYCSGCNNQNTYKRKNLRTISCLHGACPADCRCQISARSCYISFRNRK